MKNQIETENIDHTQPAQDLKLSLAATESAYRAHAKAADRFRKAEAEMNAACDELANANVGMSEAGLSARVRMQNPAKAYFLAWEKELVKPDAVADWGEGIAIPEFLK